LPQYARSIQSKLDAEALASRNDEFRKELKKMGLDMSGENSKHYLELIKR
jgi:hypothetical protein